MSRLAELHAKVDGFFTRVEARHDGDMQCPPGCCDCCHVQLTITTVEPAAIPALVESWPPDRRATLAETGAHCAALDAHGRCKIYDARPIVCRSHGAPIRMRRESLPVIESCFRNFTQTEPDADCVLDQQTLSALTLAVDRDAGGTGERVALAALDNELARV